MVYCREDSRHLIDTIKCTCTCKYFIKDAICSHLVVLNKIYKLGWFGIKCSNEPKDFIYKTKRGAKSKRFKLAEKALVRG